MMQPPPEMGSGWTEPHRGTLILVLGILSIVLCQLIGPVAWIMGRNDLQRIDSGHMDPEGRGLTQAGMICGIIATVLFLIGFMFFAVFLMLGVLGALAGA